MTEPIKLPPLPQGYSGRPWDYEGALFTKGQMYYYARDVLESPEVQDLRKDAERLNWLAEQEAQIQSLALANGTRYRLGWPDDGEAQSEWFKSPREAIDHARRIEGGGK